MIISLLVLYFGIIVLLNIPAVQRGISGMVNDELEGLLGTDVEIGNVDLGLLNRIIVQDLIVMDRDGERLLKVARFSAKFDIGALLDGQIRIQNVQLFGASVRLNKKDPKSDANFRFVLDALVSDDDKPKSVIDLRVNSVLIRRGELSYDVLSEPETPGVFNASHVGISNLSATLSLKALSADSLNVQVRRMSFAEKAGFQFKRLQLKAAANNQHCMIRELSLSLPEGSIRLDSLKADYKKDTLDNDLSYFSYKGNLVAKLVPRDFASFVPALKHFSDSLMVRMNFSNHFNRHVLSDLRLYSPNKEVLFVANGYYELGSDSVENRMKANIRQAEVSHQGFRWLYENLTGSAELPPVLERLQYGLLNAELNGTPSQLDTKLMIHTGVGMVMGQGAMSKDAKTQKRTFTGRLFSEGLQLGALLGDTKKFGNTSFNLDFKGLNYGSSGLESYINGTVYEFDYQGYKYHNISLDGNFRPGDFSGRIQLDDEHAKIGINGSLSTSGKVPVFDIEAVVRDLNTEKLNLTDKFPQTTFSGRLLAKFSGSSIETVDGILTVDSLKSVAPEEEYTYMLPHFQILARPLADGKDISVQSSFINGRIHGKFSYNSLVASINKVARMYVPSLLPGKEKKRTTKNSFNFNINIDNTDVLKRIFRLPVDLQMPASMQGSFNDETTGVYLNANIPQLEIEEKRYESVHVHLDNTADALQCQVRGNILMNKGAMMNLSLNTQAKNDLLHTTIYWGNNANVTYSGKVVASTKFGRDATSRQLLTDIDFHPSHFILNDTVWNIHPSKVQIRKDSIDIHNIHIDHQDQYVKINGRLGNRESDVCKIDLRDINILYIMDMIQFDAVKFEGAASGSIQLGQVLKQPALNARLDVRNFSLNDALLGRADIKGTFDDQKGRIMLNADIREDSTYYTRVKGFVSPKEKGLDLHIDAGGTNLALLTPFVNGIFSDLDGRAFGNIRLFGPFKELDLEGDAKAKLALNVNALNTRFKLQTDDVHIKSGEFLFQKVQMQDLSGNKGQVDGYLRHNKFSNMTYNFRFNTKEMLIFDSSEGSPEYPFYGSVYATGNAVIHGNPVNGVSVDAHLRAENKTRFVYVLGTAAEAASNQFITFVDRTPKRAREEIQTELYHYLNRPQEEEEEEDPADIRLNLQIEPTPLAEMRVLMDPVAGDYISAKGTGNLNVHFFNKGEFSMFGNYNIQEGVYKISMQNVIRKDFTLRPGGTVSFAGNPREAVLNLQAVHTVPSASLNDLMPGATSSRGNVRVNCLVNLSGNLTAPNMTFDLELPTVNEEDRQLVRSLISTPEQMTTQIIYLLGVGKFYAFDYAAQENQSNATSSLAFNTLSGQLNNMLSQVIDNQNWNLGTNLSTGQNGWTDVEAEAILSGRLLNNRLVINGNFGYRENTLQNSNFVGDFEAIWLLTKNGDFRLRGYNMTNDRYFTKSTMTTQGVGFIYKKDFTQWGELLDWFFNFKKHRKARLREKKESKAKKELPLPTTDEQAKVAKKRAQ